MKYALINPDVKIYNYSGELLGDRIVAVDIRQFEVCEPLFWIKCSDEVNQTAYYYDTTNLTIEQIPLPPDVVEQV